MMPAQRYAAFLRGVSPMNTKMPELKKAFEAAGFTDVKTVLSSGNVVFTAPAAANATLERKAEAAMTRALGRTFATIVRSLDALRAILDDNPFADFPDTDNAKRVVTFLRDAPRTKLELPIELDGARILCLRAQEVFTVYVPSPRGPVFMTLIEKTLGDQVTTRTWDTVRKVTGDHPAAAAVRTEPRRAPAAAAAVRPAQPRRPPAAARPRRPSAVARRRRAR